MSSKSSYLRDSATFARRFLMFPLTRLVIAAAILAVLMLLLSGVVLVFMPFAQLLGETPDALLVQQAIQAAAAVITLLFVGMVIERRQVNDIGLRFRGAGRDLFLGFVIGAGLMIAVVGVLALAGWYQLASRGATPGGGTAVRLLLALVLFFLVAVSEEIIFRGLLFRILEEGLGSWLALGVSGLIFGLVHIWNPNGTLIGGIGIAVDAGVQLGAAYMLTRSLYLAIGIHWAWNFFEGPIFGTPVSGQAFPVLLHGSLRGPELWTGGAFGPEAGLVGILISGAGGLALLVWAVRRGQVLPPWWKRQRAVTETGTTEG